MLYMKRRRDTPLWAFVGSHSAADDDDQDTAHWMMMMWS